MVLMYILCAALTYSGVLPTDTESSWFRIRIDEKMTAVGNAPWFRFPYPGQWGLPQVSAAGVLGMMTGLLASMIESVGDYYACAR